MALTQITTGGIKDATITTADIAADAITNAKIANNAVTVDNLPTGTVNESILNISNTGSNGQFLQKQSGNTGGLTWATPTTISFSNDADNRIVTGTGSGLNGEANFTFDGNGCHITTATPFLHLKDSDTGADSYIDAASSSGDLYLKADDNSEAGSTKITFNVDGSEKLRIDSNGRLLLGTTTNGQSGEADALTVHQSGHTGITIRTGGTSNNTAIYFADGTSGDQNYRGTIQYEHSGDRLVFKTAAAERLRIDSSGRLLVGATAKRNINNQNGNSAGDTTTPLLYAEGTGDSKSLTIVSNNTSTWRGSVLGLARTRGTSVGDNTVVQDGDNIGQIVFAAGDGTDLLSNCALIAADIDGTPGGNDTPGRLEFYTTADGAVTATERLRIDSSGNVGIGTTSPSRLLHLSGSGANCRVQVNNTNGGIGSLYVDDSDHVHVVSGEASGALILDTVGTERLRINHDGKVSIGTTNANSPVTINSGSSSNAVSIRNTTLGNGVVGILFSTQDHSGGREKAAIFHQETHGQAHYGGDIVIALNGAQGGATQVSISDRRATFKKDGGICFNSDTAYANALDDYEEGTWTPSIGSGGGGVSGSGIYTKIGNIVTAHWYDGSLTGTRNSSTLQINGLPFAAWKWTPGSMYAQVYNHEGAHLATIGAAGGTSSLKVIEWGTECIGTDFGNGYFVVSITYRVN